MVALKTLFMNLLQLKYYWKVNKIEFVRKNEKALKEKIHSGEKVNVFRQRYRFVSICFVLENFLDHEI